MMPTSPGGGFYPPLVDGMTVDYIEEPDNKRFVITRYGEVC